MCYTQLGEIRKLQIIFESLNFFTDEKGKKVEKKC